MTETTPTTAYQQIGGGETIKRVLGRVFRERVPEQPDLQRLFAGVTSNEQMLDKHIGLVGWAIGALLGGPGGDAITLEKLSEWHAHVNEGGRMREEDFNATLNVIVEEFGHENENTGRIVTDALNPVYSAAKQAIVEGRLPEAQTA